VAAPLSPDQRRRSQGLSTRPQIVSIRNSRRSDPDDVSRRLDCPPPGRSGGPPRAGWNSRARLQQSLRLACRAIVSGSVRVPRVVFPRRWLEQRADLDVEIRGGSTSNVRHTCGSCRKTIETDLEVFESIGEALVK